MEITRALIVKKEWLDKILDNGKVLELRTTRTHITGRIGLIESGTGLIVGDVALMGCLKDPVLPTDEKFFPYHQVEDLSLLKKWKYGWVLQNPKRYDEPIPYKHPKGAVIWVNLTNTIKT